jgi:hypothetical protein
MKKARSPTGAPYKNVNSCNLRKNEFTTSTVRTTKHTTSTLTDKSYLTARSHWLCNFTPYPFGARILHMKLYMSGKLNVCRCYTYKGVKRIYRIACDDVTFSATTLQVPLLSTPTAVQGRRKEAGGGLPGCSPPPNPPRPKIKTTDFVHIMIWKISCDLPFSPKQPLKSADD